MVLRWVQKWDRRWDQEAGNIMQEHSSEFDRRMEKYLSEIGFTPAMFLAESKRHQNHYEGLKVELKETRTKVDEKFDNIMKELSSISVLIAKLPCDKHDGQRLLLEARVKSIEDKPKEDQRFVYASMLACGVIGGLICTGTLKVITLVNRLLGI